MLYIATDVSDHLGAAVADQIRQRYSTSDADCVVCGVRLEPDKGDDANVIAQVRPDATVVVLAHLDCAPSHVDHIDTPLADMDDQPVEDDMLSIPALLPTHDGGQRPWLFIQKERGADILTSDGDRIEPQSSDLLRIGWDLHTRLGRNPSPVTTSTVNLFPDGSGEVVTTSGILLDQLPDAPEGWAEQVLTDGALNIGVGEFGLTRDPDAQITITNFQHAARDGQMVAARVPINTEPTTPDRTGRDLAASLADLMHVRARTGDDHPLNTAPAIVNLGAVPPTLHPALFAEDLPGLVINLHHSTNREEVLHALAAHGFERRTDLYADRWPAADIGSLFGLVWPSQIAVLASPTRKLLFSTIPTDLGWYNHVRQSQSVGLLVTQLHDIDIDTVSAAAQRGQVVITAVHVMLTE